MKYVYAALLLIWAGLLVSTVARADDVVTCKPGEARSARGTDHDSTAHQDMCSELARTLLPLVRDVSGMPCNAVIGSVIIQEKHAYFATCLVVDMTQPPNRVQQYYNYQSIDGHAFVPMEN